MSFLRKWPLSLHLHPPFQSSRSNILVLHSGVLSKSKASSLTFDSKKFFMVFLPFTFSPSSCSTPMMHPSHTIVPRKHQIFSKTFHQTYTTPTLHNALHLLLVYNFWLRMCLWSTLDYKLHEGRESLVLYWLPASDISQHIVSTPQQFAKRMSKELNERISVLIPWFLLLDLGCQLASEFSPVCLSDPRCPQYQLAHWFPCPFPDLTDFPPYLQSDKCTHSPPPKTTKLAFSLFSGAHPLPKTIILLLLAMKCFGSHGSHFLLKSNNYVEWIHLEKRAWGRLPTQRIDSIALLLAVLGVDG